VLYVNRLTRSDFAYLIMRQSRYLPPLVPVRVEGKDANPSLYLVGIGSRLAIDDHVAAALAQVGTVRREWR
jgi:hypothetical protein